MSEWVFSSWLLWQWKKRGLSWWHLLWRFLLSVYRCKFWPCYIQINLSKPNFSYPSSQNSQSSAPCELQLLPNLADPWSHPHKFSLQTLFLNSTLTLSLFMWVNWPTFQNHQNLRLLRAQLSIFMSKQRFRRYKSGYEATSVNSGGLPFRSHHENHLLGDLLAFFANLNISLSSTVDHLDDLQGVFDKRMTTNTTGSSETIF